jgi:inosine-uridine nucleoside N-ribohydrolase
MDLWSDFNIFFDPEAASIMFQADFPEIIVVGDVSNYNTINQNYLDEIALVDTPYTRLMYEYYGTEFPMWDES